MWNFYQRYITVSLRPPPPSSDFCNKIPPPYPNLALPNGWMISKHLCWRLFLIKLPALWSAILLKRDYIMGAFLWILQIFLNTYFEKHVRAAASWKSDNVTKINKNNQSKIVFILVFRIKTKNSLQNYTPSITHLLNSEADLGLLQHPRWSALW